MTETELRAAADLLTLNGMHEAADMMHERAEIARADHFHAMAERCYDDYQFADAYERDRADGF